MASRPTSQPARPIPLLVAIPDCKPGDEPVEAPLVVGVGPTTLVAPGAPTTVIAVTVDREPSGRVEVERKVWVDKEEEEGVVVGEEEEDDESAVEDVELGAEELEGDDEVSEEEEDISAEELLPLLRTMAMEDEEADGNKEDDLLVGLETELGLAEVDLGEEVDAKDVVKVEVGALEVEIRVVVVGGRAGGREVVVDVVFCGACRLANSTRRVAAAASDACTTSTAVRSSRKTPWENFPASPSWRASWRWLGGSPASNSPRGYS